jgi:pimeloyl-ACP methyl ester carboxylesterase
MTRAPRTIGPKAVAAKPNPPPPQPGSTPLQDYLTDAAQRWTLSLDVLRQRGNEHFDHAAMKAPNVLNFPVELVMDGRRLPRPVNYVLARVIPPEGAPADPRKPPIVVVDPRAGHGPGIGGMKDHSEIGAALAAGHPCYFIGFLPDPVPGQTVEDVCNAEAAFIARGAALHPDAEGKPIVIGNCQAGWQVMMMAALNPDLTGPIMLAGSPLSYWAGVHGKNPLRYLGGLLGGTWLTALAGDLGAGVFDGANLVTNFETLNLANTYWSKPYNLYAKVDAEAKRFLDFETWWGSPVLLNADEMQWIADNLFVGNKLAAGEIRTSEGARIDLRNIRAPIICFCSWGDNITPPQQALDWVLDLYDSVDDIVANGQTIIYAVHKSIGHLGIFVSGQVAQKEHSEFVSFMELIDAMPPGLYEAVIEDAASVTDGDRALITGDYLFRLERRTLDDIRAFGVNSDLDNKRFAAAARVSEINLGLYQTFLQPFVRTSANEATASFLREINPYRLRFTTFSDRNPLIAPVKEAAEQVREHRKPVSPDNPFLALERIGSGWMTTWLDSAGAMRDAMTEAFFLNAYASPWLRAMVGLGGEQGDASRRAARDLNREAAAAQLREKLEHRFEAGGLEEAFMRALIYVRQPEGSVDERGYHMLKIIRDSRPAGKRLDNQRFKDVFHEQLQLVSIDPERAMAALPKLAPPGSPDAEKALKALHLMIEARGAPPEEGQRRLARVESLLRAPATKSKALKGRHV